MKFLLFFIHTINGFIYNNILIKKYQPINAIIDKSYYKFGSNPRLEYPNIDGELTWYPIGFPKEFTTTNPRVVTVRDINYIIWKDSFGYYGLRDACSHQGSSFKNGCIRSNTISCPYHGYIFNGIDGNLLDIPDYEFKNSPSYNINSHKVVELAGIIYINTIANNRSNINIIKPNIWIEPEASNKNHKAIYLSEIFEHNAKFVTVNSLDICHIGFVHTFGNKNHPNPLTSSKIETINDAKYHYKISYNYLAGKDSLVTKLYNFSQIIVENEYIMPHTTVARVLFGNYSSTLITIAQPISKFKTRLFVKAYRNYIYSNDNYIINLFGNIITYITMYQTLKQDKIIIDNIDKTDYNTMHGKFSIKHDALSNHYKFLYKNLYEIDKFNL